MQPSSPIGKDEYGSSNACLNSLHAPLLVPAHHPYHRQFASRPNSLASHPASVTATQLSVRATGHGMDPSPPQRPRSVCEHVLLTNTTAGYSVHKHANQGVSRSLLPMLRCSAKYFFARSFSVLTIPYYTIRAPLSMLFPDGP